MTSKKSPEQQSSSRSIWRWTAAVFVLTAFAGASLYALHRAENFLMRDSRFLLAGPRDVGEESRNLRVDGVIHASRAAVMKVFDPDFGTSIYLVPTGERRRSLLAVNWVRDATVTRVWPNEVYVRITERTPVAFVQLPQPGHSGETRPALIDSEGVVLDIDNPAEFRLPVLTGIRVRHSEADRRLRVRRMLRLLEDIGARSEQLSEINASDPENLKLTVAAGGRAVVLMVGNRRFRQRMDNFYRHYNEIRLRAPDASLFDLRLEDRITAVPVASDGGAGETDIKRGGDVGQ